MAETDEQRAVRIARSILDGTTPLLLGCRTLLGPVRRLGVIRDEPFINLVGVDSETDHLPLDPDERKLWNAQVLVQKDEEIAKYTEWAKEYVIEACQAIVRRFGDGA